MPGKWDDFAEREPYFAVLTHPRYLRASFDRQAEADFFASGAGLVTEILETIHRHVVRNFADRRLSILEYGCGVGRLLLPFARHATTATGVDISPAMLAVARSHAEKAGASNIELATTVEFSGDTRQFDLVNCYLLFQRLRPSEGLPLLRSLAERVRPGGIGVFHVAFRNNARPLVWMARSARARVPALDAAIGLARGRGLKAPFIPANAYDMNEVLAILSELHFGAPYLVFQRHGDLDTVLIHAQRGAEPKAVESPEQGAVSDSSLIDVKTLIAQSSLEELNRTAEEYFRGLTDWEGHLAKPFARVDDTPQLLINLAVLIQGLNLARGLTVLEYGAGTGWLSRFLTQLGCEAILLDVSPTALRIARELYERQPVIGDQPAPRFLVFDGRRIELEDGSVDRIVCFDAFHHAPDPERMLHEFARVLRPAGIAAFAEPGPEHSRSPQSQYEMRTYGVVENDVDVHALWKAAHDAGFADLKLAAHNVMPFHVSLSEYDDLLAGGATYSAWADQTRKYMKNVRDFFLIKKGDAVLDSRHAAGLAASIDAELLSGRRVRVTVRNTGRALWLPSADLNGGVTVGAHLYDAGGRLIDFNFSRHALTRALELGEEETIEVELPALAAGSYIVELDCVANRVAWFAQTGSTPVRISLSVAG